VDQHSVKEQRMLQKLNLQLPPQAFCLKQKAIQLGSPIFREIIRLAYSYVPPSLGIAAANSALESAFKSATIPAIMKASITADPATLVPMPLITNMPAPIIDAKPIDTASQNPRTRRKSFPIVEYQVIIR
jgi:hypothetical protein